MLASEFIVTFIINTFTLIVFARNRHLRKRTTYLIINLTVADLLVGAVAGPLEVFYANSVVLEHDCSYRLFIVFVIYTIFPLLSLCNLSLISLERLHATLYPLRHRCLTGKWVYFKTIFCSWLLSLLFTSADNTVYLCTPAAYVSLYLWPSFIGVTLLIVTISYVIIILSIKNNLPPNRFGLAASERKLSITLFIVTVASMLTILPWAIWAVTPDSMWNKLSETTQIHIYHTVLVLFYACSLVNPLIYAIRMREFRKAVYKQLICMKPAEVSRVQHINELKVIQR